MNFTSGGTEQETLDLEEQKLIRQKEWEEARQRESKMRMYTSRMRVQSIAYG